MGKLIGVCLVAFFVSSFAPRAGAEAYGRREVAKETFEFLRINCLPYPEDPSQWLYEGCYSFHRGAKDLYSNKPLNMCHMPESDYNRGGYKLGVLVFLQHESLMYRYSQLVGWK